METKGMRLVPYLTFQGNCEEAMNFYAETWGGKAVFKRYSEAEGMDVPAAYRDKVLHCSFTFGDNELMACDAFPGTEVMRGSSDASMSLILKDVESGRKIFEKLVKGGKVHFPYEKQFWGAWHGSLTDKFGIKWNINNE